MPPGDDDDLEIPAFLRRRKDEPRSELWFERHPLYNPTVAAAIEPPRPYRLPDTPEVAKERKVRSYNQLARMALRKEDHSGHRWDGRNGRWVDLATGQPVRPSQKLTTLAANQAAAVRPPTEENEMDATAKKPRKARTAKPADTKPARAPRAGAPTSRRKAPAVRTTAPTAKATANPRRQMTDDTVIRVVKADARKGRYWDLIKDGMTVGDYVKAVTKTGATASYAKVELNYNKGKGFIALDIPA